MTANENNTNIVNKCQKDFLSLLFRSGNRVAMMRYFQKYKQKQVISFEVTFRWVVMVLHETFKMLPCLFWWKIEGFAFSNQTWIINRPIAKIFKILKYVAIVIQAKIVLNDALF